MGELRSPFFSVTDDSETPSNVNGTSSRALAKRPYTGCEKTQMKNAPGAPDPPATPVSHSIKNRHRHRYRHRDGNRNSSGLIDTHEVVENPLTLRLFSNVTGTSSRALAKRPYTGCEKTQVKNAPGAPDPPAAPVSHGIKSRHRYRYRDRHRDRNRPRPGYNVYLYSQEKSLTS